MTNGRTGSVGGVRGLRGSDDFAEGAGWLHNVDVGLRGVFQWDFGADDRAQCAVFPDRL
jgi:hypothetical protein